MPDKLDMLHLKDNNHTDPTATTPLIFKKKQKKSLIKTLEYINSDTGKTRHYPPAAQEWYNSIYTYNQNYTKSLPALDKSLMALLNSYTNMQPRVHINTKKIIKGLKLEIKRGKLKGTQKKLVYARLRDIPKRLLPKYNRLSPRKVFVGRGDLKHTNNKVLITLYTHSVFKTFLIRKIKRFIQLLYFPQQPLVLYMTKGLFDINTGKRSDIISYNRPLSLDEFLHTPSSFKMRKLRSRLLDPANVHRTTYHNPLKIPTYWITFYEGYLSFIIRNVEAITISLKKINRYFILLSKLKKKNLITNIGGYFTPIAAKFQYSRYSKRFYFNRDKARKVYLNRLLLFSWALYSHSLRFKDPILVSGLKYLVKNLYGKDVEFNVVELKKMHSSSDIFTQAVTLKLKNRDNMVLRVLKSSLTRVLLPNVRRDSEKFNTFKKEEYLVNKIRNTYVNTMIDNNATHNLRDTRNLTNYSNTKDSLTNLLLGFFPSANTMVDTIKKRFSFLHLPVSTEKYVLKNLKHLKLAGVRVEAKGRLTRRFTAQRSVYNMKYKGGLKNVDSSFRGLPAVMLRGIVKSNVQYSVTNSNNLIGAYGVKGWIANK